MTLMLAGVAFLAASVMWHAGLAVLCVRARAQRDAPVTPEPGGSSAAPQILWLVLINPTPTALAAARAARLRPRCRTRVVVVTPEASGAPEAIGGVVSRYPDAHHLAVPPELDRATLLNRAVRLIWRRTTRAGEDPARVVVGIIGEHASPDENVAVAVWYAFADAQVGAVQARIQTLDAGALGAAEQYERGVLGDATNLLRGRQGAAHLEDTGAFVRLSALRALGRRPWRPGANQGGDLGRRLRDLGMRIDHDPRLRVIAGPPTLSGALRRQVLWAQRLLQDSPLRRDVPWSERVAWLPRLCAWLLPAGGVVAVSAWFASTAMAAWPAADGSRLTDAALVWVAALLAPALVWWGARRDTTLLALGRGALARPVLAALRPVALLWAMGRQVSGRRTLAWVAEADRGSTRVADTRTWPAPAGLALGRGGLDSARPVAASVFVDLTGRRRRRMWMAVRVAGVAGLAYVIAFGYALVGQPLVPAPTVVDSPAPEPTGPVAQEPPVLPEPTRPDGQVPVVDTGRPAPAVGPVRRGSAPEPGPSSATTEPSPSAVGPPSPAATTPPPGSASPSVPASPPESPPAAPSPSPAQPTLSLLVPPLLSVTIEVGGHAT